MDLASEFGHGRSLTMVEKSELVGAKYSASAIDMASHNGHVARGGLKLRYTHEGIDEASLRGRVPVLQWWRESGLKMRYTNAAMEFPAERAGDYRVLDCGIKPARYTTRAVDSASLHGHTNALQWWLESGFELRYTCGAVDRASAWGSAASLEWWKDSQLSLNYTKAAMDQASANGHLHVLEWWKRTAEAMAMAAGAGRMDDPHSAFAALQRRRPK
ncbi:hypothetical protein DFJ73DRAFT_874447 [Zopfochytrium polystomum]|nr:hypothetical protein DFJ73DRAFT_874447 [Zopfochytrium polystomum]